MSDQLLCPRCKAVGIWREIFWAGKKGYQFGCADCGYAGPISSSQHAAMIDTGGLPMSIKCWDCGRQMHAVTRQRGPVSEPWWVCVCSRISAVTQNDLVARWAPLVAAGLVDVHAWPWESSNG
jgi:hypothetical protein